MMELTKEKSERQAMVILGIGVQLRLLDEDYCLGVAKEMRSNASMADSAAPLIRGYNPKKQNLVRLKAEALETICKYKALLKEADELQKEIGEEESHQEKIEKLFL